MNEDIAHRPDSSTICQVSKRYFSFADGEYAGSALPLTAFSAAYLLPSSHVITVAVVLVRAVTLVMNKRSVPAGTTSLALSELIAVIKWVSAWPVTYFVTGGTRCPAYSDLAQRISAISKRRITLALAGLVGSGVAKICV